ncbi:DUF1707 domain-containing protein [Streptomyces sp. NPDC059850]|uniref:DUF1707 SHOCT-like domain-containing protein n=1 Tax=Streptomyces sp. NPDC059850 TaxID=3346970 RepID=UPI003661498E
MDEQQAQQPVPLTKSPPTPVTEAEIRASDADRDRVADILREALAEGRLEPEEHAERIDAVYRAKTLGELEPLVRDVPAGPARATAGLPSGAAPDAVSSPENLIAVFGSAVRKGRWRPRSRTHAFAVFGGVEIDLTEAVFEQREIVIQAWAVFGGVDIKVPENVSLHGSGSGVFGGVDVAEREAPDPDAPVVRVSGFALFGGIDAKPKRGKRVKNLRS